MQKGLSFVSMKHTVVSLKGGVAHDWGTSWDDQLHVYNMYAHTKDLSFQDTHQSILYMKYCWINHLGKLGK